MPESHPPRDYKTEAYESFGHCRRARLFFFVLPSHLALLPPSHPLFFFHRSMASCPCPVIANGHLIWLVVAASPSRRYARPAANPRDEPRSRVTPVTPSVFVIFRWSHPPVGLSTRRIQSFLFRSSPFWSLRSLSFSVIALGVISVSARWSVIRRSVCHPSVCPPTRWSVIPSVCLSSVGLSARP